MQVREYVKEDGTSPYGDWFARLNPQAAAKVAIAVYRLGLGNTSKIKWFAGIGELRIDWGPGYRIYLARDGEDLVILYAGGTKATQARDIHKTQALHAEYKARKRARRPT